MARQRRRSRRVYRQQQDTPPPSIDRGERLEKCLDLRRAGKSYAEIGKEVGLNASTVYRLIHAEMTKRRERYAEKADQLIQMQLDRLEWLWNKMQGQMEEGYPRAVEVGISILKRQAELLGLDKPIRIHNTHELIELSDDELRAEAERLRLQIEHREIPQLLPGETADSVPREIIDAEIVPRDAVPVSLIPSEPPLSDAPSSSALSQATALETFVSSADETGVHDSLPSASFLDTASSCPLLPDAAESETGVNPASHLPPASNPLPGDSHDPATSS